MKVKGVTDVSEEHFGFVFRTDVNRVTLHRAIEYFSALSAMQHTFTPKMDWESTVSKRSSLFRDITQCWLVGWYLVVDVSERSVGPIFKGQAVKVP